MRIGTISQGKIKCDNCGQTVIYAGRYLIVKEKDGVEDEENGEARYYCVKCATKKGYTQYRQEKGEHILTFFQNVEKVIEPVDQLEPAEQLEPSEPAEAVTAESSTEEQEKDENE